MVGNWVERRELLVQLFFSRLIDGW